MSISGTDTPAQSNPELHEQTILRDYEGELATYALAKVIEGVDNNPQLRHILATGQEIVTD